MRRSPARWRHRSGDPAVRYPSVLSEGMTLRRVLHGASLARFGDGELNLAEGLSIPCQRHSPELQRRLREILQDSGECLVGIPNLDSATPKAQFWHKYHRVTPLLAARPYASSFISRPDSAPWINTAEFWAGIESLWDGLDVTVVRGNLSTKGLLRSDLEGAKSVREILCPRKDAFEEYADILEAIGTHERVLLCLGPTATVLAVDLCRHGVHAVDVGHVALFLRKYRRGEPMVVTDEDRAAA